MLPALKPRLLVLLSGPAPAVVVLVGILGNNDNNYLIIRRDSLPCSYRGFIYEAMKQIAQPSPAEAGELLMIASVHCIQCGQTVPGNTQWGYRAARQDSRSFIEIIIIEFIQLE